MPITLSQESAGNILVVHFTGKLGQADYAAFVPGFERLVQQHGKLRLMFAMTDFYGWEMGAVWEEVRFAACHFFDAERLATVGHEQWDYRTIPFRKPFTKAAVRYYDYEDMDQARLWLSAA